MLYFLYYLQLSIYKSYKITYTFFGFLIYFFTQLLHSIYMINIIKKPTAIYPDGFLYFIYIFTLSLYAKYFLHNRQLFDLS